MLVLSKTISALKLVCDESGRTREYVLTQLPSKSVLELCGDGFNSRTVQVRSGGATYFVFREDLQIVIDGPLRAIKQTGPILGRPVIRKE